MLSPILFALCVSTATPYEAAVHKAVTAWFAGQDLQALETQLAADAGTVPPTAAEPYARLQSATAKLIADAKRGVTSFESPDVVNYAVAQAAIDVAMARIAQAAIDTAVGTSGVTPPPREAADIANLGTRLADLAQTLDTP